jgi:chemosensory pili system protein ChpA (sensor histidine kinase/response regulator)
VATVQRNLQRTVESTEDDLIAQARQTRELQRDLLRTRMVEFEGISERLYRVVRQASKDVGKQVKLDIIGGSMDHGPQCARAHGPRFRAHAAQFGWHTASRSRMSVLPQASRPWAAITIELPRKATTCRWSSPTMAGARPGTHSRKGDQQGMIVPTAELGRTRSRQPDLRTRIFNRGSVTELSGEVSVMDVVRNEVNALGGRIETSTRPARAPPSSWWCP